MVEAITIAIVGLVITGIGLGVAIFFNAFAIRDSSKIRHYDILRNFEEKFHEIQDIDIQKDPFGYPMKLVNWCNFMYLMNKEKIIPTKFLKPSKNVFGEARWILSNIYHSDDKEEDNFQDYIDWCKKHGFEEKKTSPKILAAIGSKNKEIRTLTISETPSDHAQLFWCPKCKKFFRTSEDLSKHKDDKHSNQN